MTALHRLFLSICLTMSLWLPCMLLTPLSSLSLLTSFVNTAADVAADTGKETGDENNRSIYIGDIITLDITTAVLSADELRERFRDFEVVELKQKNNGYLLSLRCFEPGVYTVGVSDKEIVITVASTLDDIDRADIFEGGTQMITPSMTFPWHIFFFVSVGIFVLSSSVALWKIIRQKPMKAPTPYQCFLRCTEALSQQDDHYLVDLTRCFKAFLENLYLCRISGKTSTELLHELNEKGYCQDAELMAAIEAWLTECDHLKFTGADVSIAIKQIYYERLLELTSKITQKTAQQREGVS